MGLLPPPATHQVGNDQARLRASAAGHLVEVRLEGFLNLIGRIQHDPFRPLDRQHVHLPLASATRQSQRDTRGAGRRGEQPRSRLPDGGDLLGSDGHEELPGPHPRLGCR